MNPLRTACQGLSSASDAEEFLAIDWSRPWLSCLASAGRTMAERIAKGMPVYLALNHRLPSALSDHGWQFVDQLQLPAGQAYEAFIHSRRSIPTRDNLHDFFNGLIWLHWPLLEAVAAGELATLRVVVLDAEHGVGVHEPNHSAFANFELRKFLAKFC